MEEIFIIGRMGMKLYLITESPIFTSARRKFHEGIIEGTTPGIE